MRCIKEWINRHKKMIVMALIAVALLAYLAFRYIQIASTGHRAAAMGIFLAGVALIAAIFVLFWYVSVKNPPAHKVFVIIMIPLMMLYLCVFVPYTAPDEVAHFAGAYKISNYILFRTEQFDQKTTVFREEDYDYIHRFPDQQLNWNAYESVLSDFHVFSESDEMIVSKATPSILNAPFGYLASGLALAIGRLCHFSGVVLFYWGRLANMAVFLLAAYWAIKKTPVGKMAFMAICLLPMTLHVAASYSYDCMIVAFSMMFAAQLFSFLYGTDKPVLADKIRLLLFCVLLATSKMVYAPLLLSLFLIPKERLGLTKGKSLLFKCGAVALGAAALLAMQMPNVLSVVGHAASQSSGVPHYSLSYLFTHLRESVTIFMVSIMYYGDFYLSSMIGYSLGWLQVTIPLILYLPFIIVLFCSFMKRDTERAQTAFSQKLWVLVLTLAAVFLAMLSMFLFWTPLGSPIIEGVQGRYFLPVLPFVFLLARNRFFTVKESGDRYLLFSLTVFHFLAIFGFFYSAVQ